MLKNYMEDLVDLWLPQIFRDNPEKYADVCKCSACIARMKKEALNSLKPLYLFGNPGEVPDMENLKGMPPQQEMVSVLEDVIGKVRNQAHREPQSQPSGPQFESLANLRRRRNHG